MQMYLSSYRIGNRPESLVEMAQGTTSAVVIANALDFVDDGRRSAGVGVEREINDLTALGFSASELDLRDFFGAPDALAQQLAHRPLVWVTGGNSFILRRAMRLSGYDSWMIDHAEDPCLVYGGYSAGIVLLGHTLRGIDLIDPPDQIPAGYPEQVIWEGLGLIDYSIAPHYRSDHPESPAIEDVVQYFQTHGMDYRTLRDGDVLTVTL